MIYLRNSTRKHRLNLRALKKTAQALLVAAGERGSTLSLSFVGDDAMRRLNLASRGKDRTTDVLSFPLVAPRGTPKRPRTSVKGIRAKASRAGDGAGRVELADLVPERMLGDIVISVDRAARQAADYDATLSAEISRLMIHGVLHLLGHDHEEARERAVMQREERRLARSIGLEWPYRE